MVNIMSPVSKHPFSIQIEFSSDCNLHCVMCPLTSAQTASGITKGYISQEIWDKVKSEITNVEHIFVSGFGEILIHKRCLELLEDIDKLRVTFTIVTNAHAITPETARRLMDISHLRHVNVSIDSPDPEIYQKIRGGPLERAIQGVRNLMATNKFTDRITVSSVVMIENLASLVKFPEILADLGVETYIVQGLVNYNHGDQPEDPILEHMLAEYIPQIDAACRAHNIQLVAQRTAQLDINNQHVTAQKAQPDSNNTRQCTLPWELPYIDKDGLVYPCCFAASKNQAVLGDLHKASLSEIWHSTQYDIFRTSMLSGTTLPEICRICEIVPMGQHQLDLYSAQIIPELSRLSGSEDLLLVVKNTGKKTWTAEDHIYIGVIKPRIRQSSYQRDNWLATNRIGSFRESEVPPGSYAHFEIKIQPNWLYSEEYFQLVVERQAWLPNTDFSISFAPPHLTGPTLSRSAITYITGTDEWKIVPEHDNGVFIKRLKPSVGRYFKVHSPIFCVDTEKRRYHPGEQIPAGSACTIWFDRPIKL